MWGLTLLAAVIMGKEILSEKLEKKAPANQRFDYDKYNEDIRNRVDCMEIVKRRGNGYYYTTAPKKAPEKHREVIEGVVDYERYVWDKKNIGESYAEDCRKLGFYKRIRGI